MSSFDPRFAHDTLLPLAEVAYITDRDHFHLPQNYSVVGQLSINQALAANLAVQASVQATPDLIGRMRESGDGFGWVVQNAKTQTVIATFRGTANVQDWLHDFDFRLMPYQPIANYGLVHCGFQSVYLSIAESLRNLLQQTKNECKRLILTGHSLGAALTELAAPDILIKAGLAVPPEIQNFAGPRVGNPEFANIFDVHIDTCFRIVNIWDIVPKLPPPLALFEHTGLAVNIDGGFTLDELVGHSLEESYDPGLIRLIPQVSAQSNVLMATVASARNYTNGLPIGREPSYLQAALL